MAGCALPAKEKEAALPGEASSSSNAKQEDSTFVRLSEKALQDNPIQTAVVREEVVKQELRMIGEIKADQNRVFHISSIASGRIVSDQANLGQAVRRGQTLAMIQNPETIKLQAASIHELHANEISLTQAKTRLMLAEENRKREKLLYEQGITPRKELIAANTTSKLTEAEIHGLREHRTHIQSEAKAVLSSYGVGFNPNSDNLQTGSPLKAPKTGVVIKKMITVGDAVSPDQVLYELADLSQVWLDLTVYPKDVGRLMPGYRVTFKSDSLPNKTYQGRINYIQPDAIGQSQTFVVRVFLPNPDASLKPGMFGQAVVTDENLRKSLPFVPEQGLQTYGKEMFVFIPNGNGRFDKRTVEIHSKTPDGAFIKSGLKPGETIVTQGAFALKAELLKNQLAGDDD